MSTDIIRVITNGSSFNNASSTEYISAMSYGKIIVKRDT
jgi:hypothetical protein